MKPTRILFTHELYAPDFAGGGEYVVHQAASALTKRDISVRVLTTGNPAIRDFEGIPTKRLRRHRYLLNLAVTAITREARDCDLIQTFNYHACLPSLIAGKRLNKPVICLCLGLFDKAWLQMRGPVFGRLWRSWERFTLTRSFSRLILLSGHSLETAVRLGVPRERCTVIHPGIDPPDFDPVVGKRTTVLFAGKLDVRKGIDSVMEVARALPDIPFEIAGWGPAAGELRNHAPANVTLLEGFFTGANKDELWDAYRRARIFLFPSRSETFGLSIAEAMAAGSAVVSSVPLGYAGECVNAEDRPAMIAAVRRLWNDPAECRRMGGRNVESAKAYRWDNFSGRLMAVYSETLEQCIKLPGSLPGRAETMEHIQ